MARFAPRPISTIVTAPLYNRDILRLAASIPHLGLLDAPDARVERHSPVCGSRVTVDLRIEDDRVAAIGMEVKACALGQASAALLARHVVGQGGETLGAARAELADYLSGRREEAPDWPGLDVFAAARAFSARHASILLPFDAALAALSDVPARNAAR